MTAYSSIYCVKAKQFQHKNDDKNLIVKINQSWKIYYLVLPLDSRKPRERFSSLHKYLHKYM